MSKFTDEQWAKAGMFALSQYMSMDGNQPTEQSLNEAGEASVFIATGKTVKLDKGRIHEQDK